MLAVRSLVPREKKSATSASSVSRSIATGSSSIAPTTGQPVAADGVGGTGQPVAHEDELLGPGHHRQHHPQVGVPAGPEQRAQLGVQRALVLEQQGEGGRGLVAGQERRRLVVGEVQQPHHDGSPAQHLQHRAQRVVVLLARTASRSRRGTAARCGAARPLRRRRPARGGPRWWTRRWRAGSPRRRRWWWRARRARPAARPRTAPGCGRGPPPWSGRPARPRRRRRRRRPGPARRRRRRSRQGPPRPRAVRRASGPRSTRASSRRRAPRPHRRADRRTSAGPGP